MRGEAIPIHGWLLSFMANGRSLPRAYAAGKPGRRTKDGGRRAKAFVLRRPSAVQKNGMIAINEVASEIHVILNEVKNRIATRFAESCFAMLNMTMVVDESTA
jgi:hypothetical protein